MSETEVLPATTQLEEGLKAQPPIVAGDFSPASFATSPAVFEHIQRVSKMYAVSQFVPEHYRGKVADCAVAVSMACALNVNPVMFLQRTYPVYGRIGFEGQLAIALINVCGKYKHNMQFDITGEGSKLAVKAWNTMRSGKILSADYSLEMADNTMVYEKGGQVKLSSKGSWKGNVEQKLCYMAALVFTRRHNPELLMGMKSIEELEMEGPGQSRADKLNVKVGLKKD